MDPYSIGNFIHKKDPYSMGIFIYIKYIDPNPVHLGMAVAHLKHLSCTRSIFMKYSLNALI